MEPSHTSKHILIILGCPFLATTDATINSMLGVMDISVMNMRVRVNIFNASSQPVLKDESECFFITVINEIIQEALPTILNKDPFVTYPSYGNLELFDLESTTGKLDSNLNSTTHPESSLWVCNCEPLPPFTSSPIPPSIVSSPNFNLKPSLTHSSMCF